jgi:hypothetical protein
LVNHIGRDAIETPTIARMADVNNIFDHGLMPAQILQQNLQYHQKLPSIFAGKYNTVRLWWSTSLSPHA